MTVSKNKKNNKWYYQFMINGERKHGLCAGATNQKEAELIENGIKYKLQQQQNGIVPKDLKNITMKQMLDSYMDYSRNNKKSWATDESRNKYILEFFGTSILIKDIKPEKIEKFKNHLLEIGRSKMTVNRYLEQLKTAFNQAKSNKYIYENPMDSVKKFPCKNYSIRYLTAEEEIRLFEHLPEYLKPIVTVALKTGMRKANILNLKWEEINFDYNFIELLENKGNKHLQIPLNSELQELFLSMYGKGKTGYVFVNPNTNKPYDDISNGWNTALRNAGIENFRFHDLRHTAGTRLASKNVPINVIQGILGHSDIKTTMRYVHQLPKAKIEAMELL